VYVGTAMQTAVYTMPRHVAFTYDPLGNLHPRTPALFIHLYDYTWFNLYLFIFDPMFNLFSFTCSFTCIIYLFSHLIMSILMLNKVLLYYNRDDAFFRTA